jgi:hypothetical protein
MRLRNSDTVNLAIQMLQCQAQLENRGQEYLQERVEYSCCEYCLGADFAIVDLGWIHQSYDVNVVGTVSEDQVHSAHSCHERNDAQGHDLVFPKEGFVPDVPAA